MSESDDLLTTTFDFDTVNPTTDLMAAVVAALLLVLMMSRIMYVELIGGNTDLRMICASKAAVVGALASSVYGKQRASNEDSCNQLVIPMGSGGKVSLRIFNQPTSQRFSFEGDTIFETDRADLLPTGRKVLTAFGNAIRSYQDQIEEIQIQGHTDNTGTPEHNLKLGADRAMTVYDLFVNQIRVDQLKSLVSATTFSLYQPTTRVRGQEFTTEDLDRANTTEADRTRNRRIEVVLTYVTTGDQPETRAESEARGRPD